MIRAPPLIVPVTGDAGAVAKAVDHRRSAPEYFVSTRAELGLGSAARELSVPPSPPAAKAGRRGRPLQREVWEPWRDKIRSLGVVQGAVCRVPLYLICT